MTQMFWGSNWLLEHYFPRLDVEIIDFDSSSIGSGADALLGPMVTAGLLMSLDAPVHLGWVVTDASRYPKGLIDVQASGLLCD